MVLNPDHRGGNTSPFSRAFAHRFAAAFLAISARRSGDSFSRRAAPPRRPSDWAAASLPETPIFSSTSPVRNLGDADRVRHGVGGPFLALGSLGHAYLGSRYRIAKFGPSLPLSEITWSTPVRCSCRMTLHTLGKRVVRVGLIRCPTSCRSPAMTSTDRYPAA